MKHYKIGQNALRNALTNIEVSFFSFFSKGHAYIPERIGELVFIADKSKRLHQSS